MFGPRSEQEHCLQHTSKDPFPSRSKRDSDANWYKHEPLNNDPFSTSTREQQNDPINFGGSVKPAGRHFDLGNTQVQNMFEKRGIANSKYPFSSHDHRHTLQREGIYEDFDGGRVYGRKNVRPIDKRLHSTEPSFLKHHNAEPYQQKYETSFSEAFKPYKPFPLEQHRRFPKEYAPPNTGLIELNNNVTKWIGNDMDYIHPFEKTDTLCLSQWKRESLPVSYNRKQWCYSYHNSRKGN